MNYSLLILALVGLSVSSLLLIGAYRERKNRRILMTRLNSKEERGEILLVLIDKLITSKCLDIEILTLVDRLCRRTWHDIHPGWIRWSYYMSKLLDQEQYDKWAQNNSRKFEEK